MSTLIDAVKVIGNVIIGSGIVMLGVYIAVPLPRLLYPDAMTLEAQFLYSTVGTPIILFGLTWIKERAWGFDANRRRDRLLQQMASDVAILKDEVQESKEREAKMLILLERMQNHQHELTEENDNNYVPRTYSN